MRGLALGFLLAISLVACQEKLTSPGGCPELCPSDNLVIEDVVLEALLDSTFTGFLGAGGFRRRQDAETGDRPEPRLAHGPRRRALMNGDVELFERTARRLTKQRRVCGARVDHQGLVIRAA